MPEARFNSLTDSLKIEKTKEFLTEILKEKDIEKMRIQNNHEIKKEMKLWSKRTLSGLLFDKKISKILINHQITNLQGKL